MIKQREENKKGKAWHYKVQLMTSMDYLCEIPVMRDFCCRCADGGQNGASNHHIRGRLEYLFYHLKHCCTLYTLELKMLNHITRVPGHRSIHTHKVIT